MGIYDIISNVGKKVKAGVKYMSQLVKKIKKTDIIRCIKCVIPSVAILCILWVVFIFAITLCAAIPKSLIEGNVKKCADYYANKYMFQQMTKDENSTIVHNYADLVWINIAWSQDSEHPFVTALEAPFYEGKEMYKSESLIRTVYGSEAPDNTYTRYWHGSLIFIKPMLIFTDISGIRIINAVICILCAVILCIMLVRNKMYALSAGYITALGVSFSYIIPLCMEYMPSFVLMHIISISVLSGLWKQGKNVLCAVFTASGALVCFFDFLTNEILTLFVPLIFLLWQKDKNGERIFFKDIVLYSAMWFLGYAGTWIFKWIISWIVLGRHAFENAITNGAYRMAGVVPDIEQNQIAGAVVKNINRLFPLNFVHSEAVVWVIAVIVIFTFFCVCFLYRKEKIPKLTWLLLIIALLPYARYMVMSNHSCLHPFFTFRTQIITVIAFFGAMASGIDFDLIWGRKKCKKKN